MTWFKTFRSTPVALIFAFSFCASFSTPAQVFAQDEPLEVQADKKLDELFESKETKYKREMREEEERRREEEETRWKEEQIRKNRAEIERLRGKSVKKSPSAVLPSAATKVPGDIVVEVFRVPNCPPCNKTEEFLRETNVPFTSYDLKSDANAERDYLNTMGRGVIPAIRVNGKVVRGYRPDEIRRLIREVKNSQPEGS